MTQRQRQMIYERRADYFVAIKSPADVHAIGYRGMISWNPIDRSSHRLEAQRAVHMPVSPSK